MVTKRVLASAGVAVVPIPGADLIAGVGQLANVPPRISEAFELDQVAVEKLEPAVAERALVIASSLGYLNGGTIAGRSHGKEMLRDPL